MRRTKEDIYQNETDPALYLKRARENRNRKIEEAVVGIVLFALLGLTFAIVQVASGIW